MKLKNIPTTCIAHSLRGFTASGVVKPLLWAALALTPAQVYANECETDDDCGAGRSCELLESEVPCSIDSEGNENCDDEGESYRVCVETPIECETDEDCPSHLTCVEANSSIETGISGSSMSSMSGGGAPSPPPPESTPQNKDEGMICAFIPAECQSDDDCGENFSCEDVGYSFEDCAVPEEVCPEGEVCEPTEPVDCEGEEVTESLCIPQEIECGSDSDCPTDWRCQEFEGYTCDEEDIAIDEPGSDGEDDPEGNIEEPQEEDCEEEIWNLCIPVGLHLGAGSGEPISHSVDPDNAEISPTEGSDDNQEAASGSNDDNGASAEPNNSNEADANTDDNAGDTTDNDEGAGAEVDEEKDGCDASPRPVTPWTLGGFIALGMLLRRRFLIS